MLESKRLSLVRLQKWFMSSTEWGEWWGLIALIPAMRI